MDQARSDARGCGVHRIASSGHTDIGNVDGAPARYFDRADSGHASGYVGEVSEKQIEASGGKLRPGDVAGQSGLEREYNDLLVGTDGMRRVIVNSVGKEMGHFDSRKRFQENRFS